MRRRYRRSHDGIGLIDYLITVRRVVAEFDTMVVRLTSSSRGVEFGDDTAARNLKEPPDNR